MGHIIPAGTGFNTHREVAIKALVQLLEDTSAADILDQPSADNETISKALLLPAGPFPYQWRV